MVSIRSVFSEGIKFIGAVFPHHEERIIVENIITDLEKELEGYKKEIDNSPDYYPELSEYYFISIIVEKESIYEWEIEKIIETVKEAIDSEKKFY